MHNPHRREKAAPEWERPDSCCSEACHAMPNLREAVALGFDRVRRVRRGGRGLGLGTAQSALDLTACLDECCHGVPKDDVRVNVVLDVILLELQQFFHVGDYCP